MKKMNITVIGTLCILIGIALTGCIDYSGESPEKTIQKDSDFDGWTDIQEREAHTNPFDADTDHDGIWDPEDPDPSRPGILTDTEQKLEVGRYVEFDLARMYPTGIPKYIRDHLGIGDSEHYNITREDVRLPKGSALIAVSPPCSVGYTSGRLYWSYEIYASSPQVADFFLEEMAYKRGWQVCDRVHQFERYGICEIRMYYLRPGDQDLYRTIIVIGQEEGRYSQFIIIEDSVD